MSALSSTLGQGLFLYGGEGQGGWLGDTWTFVTRWTEQPVAGPSRRSGHAVAALGNQVVVFGGTDATTGASLDDTWTFNGAGWTHLPAGGPPARSGHAMAELKGRIVLFGGADAGKPYGDTWTFDGSEWARVMVTGPPARSAHAMATLP